MKLRSLMASAFGVVALAQFATPASAITLLSEDFGTGNPDQFNITGDINFGSSQFKVTAGNVDLIGNGVPPNGSYNLYPGNGNYIDLNGNTPGAISSKNTFSFAAGETATVSFSFGTNGTGKSADVFLGTKLVGIVSPSTANFQSFSLDVLTPMSGALSFVSTNPGAGGIILDSISLEKNPTAAVPEPFTIIGTLIGGTAAIRTRKKLKAAAKV